MMISFARTTAALVAGRKSVTRRTWAKATRERFQRQLAAAIAAGEPGIIVDAWSKSPRFNGKKIGTVLVTSVTEEPTKDIPDSDWEAEGFAFMEEHGILVEKEQSCADKWKEWREGEDSTSVIRFELHSLAPGVTVEEFLPQREVA